MMDNHKDAGVIAALMKRFETQRLPRAIALKKKVDQGSVLEEHELDYLEKILSDSKMVNQLLDRHPEYHDLYARAMSLYKEITDKAVENEKKRPG